MRFRKRDTTSSAHHTLTKPDLVAKTADQLLAEDEVETVSTWDIGVGHFYDRLQEAARAARVYGAELTHGKTNPDVLTAALHPNATLTVCTYVFNPSRTKTLLVKHPKFGWVPPGGHIDGREHPRAAAKRELREETGLTVGHFRHAPASLSYSSKGRLGMIGYVVYVSETQPLTPETEAQWFRLGDLPESAFPGDPDRIRSAALDVSPAEGPYKLTLTNNDHIMDEVGQTEYADLESALVAWQEQHVSDLEAERRWGYRPLLVHLTGTTV
jgi:8-oxo-dGTP diphosphatase